MEKKQAVEMLVDTGRRIMEKGLTWGNAGNISVKLDENHILITASGSRLDSLTEDCLTLWELSAQKHWGGKPSKELPVHLKVYETSSWASAVLHTSPLHATMFSVSGLSLNNRLFVENMYYLQRVCRIPYCHPGSAALRDAVRKAAPSHNVMLLDHHGVLAYDTSLAEACMAVEVLENTCRMQLLALGAGLRLDTLDEETVQDFLLRSGYKAPRMWPDTSGTEQ
jgi:3-dehydro-4-phosphotetronate decarboxylase